MKSDDWLTGSEKHLPQKGHPQFKDIILPVVPIIITYYLKLFFFWFFWGGGGVNRNFLKY